MKHSTPRRVAPPVFFNVLLFVLMCIGAAVNPLVGLFCGTILATRIIYTPERQRQMTVDRQRAERRELWGL